MRDANGPQTVFRLGFRGQGVQAHSDAEQGTLRYFLNDGGVRNTFNFSQAGQERGPHE